ncbi:hypothetical protein FBEOM_9586 [Fusarium beomiforme]|uniref:Uncharacterized protein n=1 Tax=Fusarium beomiforme TaxID=44412 RepID=A0A9P5ADT3_9HYPO|nr:hypothetical protein FBEOM_9586 [Fusarium beomiforme]
MQNVSSSALRQMQKVLEGTLIDLNYQGDDGKYIYYAIGLPSGGKTPEEPSITWDELLTQHGNRFHNLFTRCKGPADLKTEFLLHLNSEQLQVSADKGCASCSLIRARTHFLLPEQSQTHGFTLPIIKSRFLGVGNQFFSILFNSSGHDSILHGDQISRESDIRLDGPSHGPDAWQEGQFEQTPDTSRIIKWLKTCRETHHDCNKRLRRLSKIFPGQPRRLLRIGQNNQGLGMVYLEEYDTKACQGPSNGYATLSHC